MLTYATFKMLHVFGVVFFLGNIIVTGVWKYRADVTGRPEVIAFAQRLVTLTDWVFTFGGVLLILIGGFGMVQVAGLDIVQTPWIRHGLIFFGFSGIIWALILIPIQILQARLARGFEAGGAIPDRYWRLNRQWYIWGSIATVLPLLNIYVMVQKV
ncbi:MAG: DUF2269 domain-containing protein [Proteobacteria bacterium]|nr:DUF2269 domain-containing protein [Pseudomonadota bacterium]